MMSTWSSGLFSGTARRAERGELDLERSQDVVEELQMPRKAKPLLALLDTIFHRAFLWHVHRFPFAPSVVR